VLERETWGRAVIETLVGGGLAWRECASQDTSKGLLRPGALRLQADVTIPRACTQRLTRWPRRRRCDLALNEASANGETAAGLLAGARCSRRLQRVAPGPAAHELEPRSS